MNRKDFQAIAEHRLKDAHVLYANKRFDGAYYLAGYVVECALKACIAKRTKRHDFPDKRFVERIYQHDLSALLGLANLGDIFKQEFRLDSTLEVKWGLVKDWNEQSRYETHGRRKAHDMLEAVASHQGILVCIKKYW